MSYRGRKQWNREAHDRKPPVPVETPADQLSRAIFAFGDQPDSDHQLELEKLAVLIRDADESLQDTAAEAIAIAVPTFPHKVPYLATLVVLLYVPDFSDSDDASVEPDPLGSRILHSCWRHCREAMADRLSRKFRAWIHFFSCLCDMKVVAPQTLLEFLQNISLALEELGASTSRLLKASVCIAVGLLHAGSILFSHDPAAVKRLVEAVSSAVPENANKELTYPFMSLHRPAKEEFSASEFSVNLSSLLQDCASRNFESVQGVYPSPHANLSIVKASRVKSFAMESVLLPPEQVELTSSVSEIDQMSASDKEFPQFIMALFDNEITPDIRTVEGYTIHNLVSDIVTICEINRKEGAKTLLSLSRWLSTYTFKPKPVAELQQNGTVLDAGGWQLESTIVEILLVNLVNLPNARIHPAYCSSLICELCKLSPSTFGPAVGKSIRKLHNFIGDGLDVEIIRRYGDWFATHMSNFGFQWVWKEWLSDLELSDGHPRKNFLCRILELEVRLAYFDRIVRSVPEPFHSSPSAVLPQSAPSPDYTYGDPNHPHSAIARDVLNWFQGRTDALEVIAGVEAMKERLMDNGENESSAMSTLRFIVVESLLEIGARSFSHFLNAIERYLKVMRFISVDPQAKGEILEATGRFWKKNSQMLVISFDKLMQYQFIDPSDVVLFAFRRGSNSLDALGWTMVCDAIEKANGRVVSSQRRIVQLRKEQDDMLATQRAQADTDMEYDGAARQESSNSLSTNLASALEAPIALIAEQRRTLGVALENFLKCLTGSSTIVTADSWHIRETWSEGDWLMYETWGWYRNFCRMYASHIAMHREDLRQIFQKHASSAPAAVVDLLQSYWQATQ